MALPHFFYLMKKIDSFTGQYHFLSNFYIHSITYQGKVWPSTEHAYQAAKTFVPAERETIRLAGKPGEAKKLGREVTLRVDWERVKVPTMLALLELKFSDPMLEGMLLATDGSELVEGNYWGDRFWGVDSKTGIGKNMLGKLLMQIREEKLAFS